MTIELLKEKLEEVIESMKKSHVLNDDGGYEIYADYCERELSDKCLKDIFEYDNPREYFNDLLAEQADDYAVSCGWDFINDEISDKLTEEEQEFFDDYKDEAEITEFLSDRIYFYYDANDFNNDVYVNILVDCGNWNFDCTCDNVLNWYGNSGDGSLDDTSSMLWLAKTQDKEDALRKVCKKVHNPDGDYAEREGISDPFLESCVQEFENLPSHMGTVTFLVKMKLFQLFDLYELKKQEYDEQYKYTPQLNEKSKSYMVIGKETMCGLYDCWSGGGSVLEIALDKDVQLPIKYARFAVDGCNMLGCYDVGSVYGMCKSAWKESLKGVVTPQM